MASEVNAPSYRENHRRFLNEYYGISRHFYDLTRKYYLLGRDREIRALLAEDWESLIEIGPGTGRNLRSLYRSRPIARYGGVEASDEMLSHARRLCPFAAIVQGFAEDANLKELLGAPPDRILFSYCLSMVQKPLAAIENAVESLAPDGELVIVDFGDFTQMPKVSARALDRWLGWFHVSPPKEALLRTSGAEVDYGPGHYYLRARITKAGWEAAKKANVPAAAFIRAPRKAAENLHQKAAQSR